MAPGPYEGERVLDKEGRFVGRILGLNVTGQRVASFTVETPEGKRVHVPRDLFQETTRDGIVLTADRDTVLTDAAADRSTGPA